jgi:hypothetical protein
MPIKFGMKRSSYFCSQNTGGVENAVPLHVDIPCTSGTGFDLPSNILCRNIRYFPANVFFQFFFRSRVTAASFVLQTIPEGKNHKD